jgi:hypothetical protein
VTLPNRITLAQLREMGPAKAAALPLDQLALLLDEVAALKADAKRLGDLLHDALDARFSAAASAARREEGKDTGRVRLEQDGFEVVADLPKKVEWQQARLAAAVATLREWGEDPADYVATELRVPEARFSAWPPRIRALFEPARTVRPARPTYTLTPKEPA